MSVYSWLHHTLHVSWVLQAALLAAAILVGLGVSVRRRLATPDGGLLPDEGVTLRNMIEVVVEGLADLGHKTIGHDYRKYFPLVGAIFFFILISNLLGLVPGVGGASSDINTGFAWALIVFCVYQYAGIRKKGWRYIEHFMGPVMFERELFGTTWHVRALAPLLLPIELVLDASRIATLSIRLLANMFADHTVVAIWYSLVPVVIPAVFMGLGLLIAFIQAFVFSLLSMIYIGLAFGLAGLGCGLGQGLTAGNTTAGIARNPGAAGALNTPFILGMALIESIALVGFVTAFLLIGKV